MRIKKKYLLIVFSSTTQAMAMEAFCKEQGLLGRIIPVPQDVSAGCGLAWRVAAEDYSLYEKYKTSWQQFAAQVKEYIM